MKRHKAKAGIATSSRGVAPLQIRVRTVRCNAVMTQGRSLLFVLAALAWLTVTAFPVSAESFGDLHLGRAVTQDGDVTTKARNVEAQFQDLDFDNSTPVGSRFNHWFKSWPYLGVALGVSRFGLGVDKQTITSTDLGINIPGAPVGSPDVQVTDINFGAMLRWPLLASKEFPEGQIQPYFTVGPGIFLAHLKDTTKFVPTTNQSDTSAGVKVRTGVAWRFHQNVMFFGDYRFTHFSSDVIPDTGIGKTKGDTQINTHRAVVGISIHF